MRETELKAVVADELAMRRALDAARARHVLSGAMVDRRYDTTGFGLRARDEVLRVRITTTSAGRETRLDYKSAASFPDGYKVRDEIGTTVDDPEVLERILAQLGYVVTREIEREIAVYEVHEAIVRIERYPRLDTLVEVEGTPETIERAIAVLEQPRASFTTDSLAEFVRRFEARTGQRAALCTRELQGDARYRLDDA